MLLRLNDGYIIRWNCTVQQRKVYFKIVSEGKDWRPLANLCRRPWVGQAIPLIRDRRHRQQVSKGIGTTHNHQSLPPHAWILPLLQINEWQEPYFRQYLAAWPKEFQEQNWVLHCEPRLEDWQKLHLVFIPNIQLLWWSEDLLWEAWP